MNLLVIQYYQEITVLRFRLTSTVAVPGKSRGRGRKRRPNPWPESRTAGTYFLKKKFQYMRNVFSRRNVAQHRFSLPLLDYEQQILTSIFWYIYMAWCCLRHSSINFTTPEGGMELVDVSAKCRACILKNGIGVVRWLLSGRHIYLFLGSWNTYSFIFHEWVYMEPQRKAEICRALKLRMYDTLRIMCTAETKPRDVRIVQLQPVTD